MGAIRKAASVCTFGLVRFTSRREAQTSAYKAQAKLTRAEARETRQRTAQQGGEYGKQQAADVLEYRRTAREILPWYRQPTIGDALYVLRSGNQPPGKSQ